VSWFLGAKLKFDVLTIFYLVFLFSSSLSDFKVSLRSIIPKRFLVRSGGLTMSNSHIC
jgi:hypothetical protein